MLEEKKPICSKCQELPGKWVCTNARCDWALCFPCGSTIVDYGQTSLPSSVNKCPKCDSDVVNVDD